MQHLAVARLAAGGWTIDAAGTVRPTDMCSHVHAAAHLELAAIFADSTSRTCAQRIEAWFDPDAKYVEGTAGQSFRMCTAVRAMCAVGDGVSLLAAVLDALGIRGDLGGVRGAVARWGAAEGPNKACETVQHCAAWWRALRHFKVTASAPMWTAVHAVRDGRSMDRRAVL